MGTLVIGFSNGVGEASSFLSASFKALLARVAPKATAMPRTTPMMIAIMTSFRIFVEIDGNIRF